MSKVFRDAAAVRKQMSATTAARRRSGLRHVAPLQLGQQTLAAPARRSGGGGGGGGDDDDGLAAARDAQQYVLPGLGVFATLDIWLQGLARAKQLDTLALENPIPGLDGRVSFQDEGHIYTDKRTGRRVGASVTKLIKAPFGEFNKEGALGGVAGSRRWRSEPGYEYHAVAAATGLHQLIADTVGEWPRDDRTDPVCMKIRHIYKKMVAAYWDAARDAGTRLHAYIEAYYNGHRSPLTPLLKFEDPAYAQFHQYQDEWVRDHDLVPFRTELNLYWDLFDLAGQADMIWQRRSDRDAGRKILIVHDWKRSKEIKYRGRGRGRPPCAHMPDCNYSHYSLQLNIYSWFIEQCSEYTVDECALVVFHPTQSTYAIHPVPMMRELAAQLMAQRLQEVMLEQERCGAEAEFRDAGIARV